MILVNNKKGIWVKPSGGIVSGVEQLFRIMNNIIDDFITKTEKIKANMVPIQTDSESLWFKNYKDYDDFSDLLYLSIISYTTVFFSLECGLKSIYEELNELNKKLNLNLNSVPLPKRDKYIYKLRLVRNKSCAHWGERVNENNIQNFLDQHAGYFIGSYNFPNNGDLLQAQWGGTSVSKTDEATGKHFSAQDRMLKPLPETHDICLTYIRELDNICKEYLDNIKLCLPIIQNDIEYSLTRKS